MVVLLSMLLFLLVFLVLCFVVSSLSICRFANSAATKIIGSTFAYKKLSGHLTPWPDTRPKLSGISTFIACTYTTKKNTASVAIILAIGSAAVLIEDSASK
jgi:hypothetical protein